MNNGRLKEILEQYPDEYEIGLSIGEEANALSHVFVDNDSGVIELTDYTDDDCALLDMFDNPVREKARVLVIDEYTEMRKGTITSIIQMTQNKSYLVTIRIEGTDRTLQVFIDKDNPHANKKFIIYKW